MLTSYQIPETAARELGITKDHPVYKKYDAKEVNGFMVHNGDGYPEEIGVEEDGIVISWEQDDPVDLMRQDHADYIRQLINDQKCRPCTILKNKENGHTSFSYGNTNPSVMKCHRTQGADVFYNPHQFDMSDSRDRELLETLSCLYRRDTVYLTCPNGSDDPKDWTA